MSVIVASCARGLGIEESPLLLGPGDCRAGDVVAARVTSIGSYPAVEVSTGREQRLWEGDVVVGVLGVRRSTTSIYGDVPEGLSLAHMPQLDLLSVGGVLGQATGWPSTMGRPTSLKPLGRVLDPSGTGEALALVPRVSDRVPQVPVILIGGTAAEVGKTTASAKLVHFLTAERGLRVGAAKLTGTGRMRDLRALLDAGAVAGEDFVDAGVATTYGLDAPTTAGVACWLINRLEDAGVDIVVAELGGDLSGGNVLGILSDRRLASCVRHLVVVGSDAMAALGAQQWLTRHDIPYNVSFAVPRRNPRANEERLMEMLGECPIDPDSAPSLVDLMDRVALAVPPDTSRAPR